MSLYGELTDEVRLSMERHRTEAEEIARDKARADPFDPWPVLPFNPAPPLPAPPLDEDPELSR